MNKIIIFILCFNSQINLFSQNTVTETIDTLNLLSYDELNKNVAYDINYDTFNFLKDNNNKKMSLIYTYALWCKPCRETLPEILKIANNNKKNIDFYLILTESKSKEIQKAKKHLNSIENFDYPIFNISNEYSKKVVKKYDHFIQNIIPGHKDYGLSLIILFNENGKPIYLSTYNETKVEKLETLKNKLKRLPTTYKHNKG